MSDYQTVNPFERDFIQSWERIEEFFGLMLARVPWKDRVLQFIAELRQAGYDRKLRAGQTIDIFIVSRSRITDCVLTSPVLPSTFIRTGWMW